MPKMRSPREPARPTRQPANPRIVPFREIPAFLRALRRSGDADAAADALEWLILTAARTNEVLDARLSDISEAGTTWMLTAARIKSVRPRAVPLAARAREIFAACKRRHSGTGDYLFEAARGRPPHAGALLARMRRIQAAGVPHGFRYSFRRWAAEHGYAPGALAKASPDAYRKMMVAWSRFCAGG